MIFLILLSILFFPAIIFLDYHKRKDIRKSIYFLILFFGVSITMAFLVKKYAFGLLPFVFIFPFFFFGILILKNIKNAKPQKQ